MRCSRFLTGMMVAASLVARQAAACSVCMGSAEDTMTRGMQAGIFVLLGVIVSVLLGVVGFMGYLIRRGHRIQAGDIITG